MKSNKKTDQKTIIIFISIIVACTFLGIITGVLIRKITDTGVNINSFLSSAKYYATYIIPCLYIVICISVGTFCRLTYSKAKKAHHNWNGKDENVIDEAEYMLNKCLFVSNIYMIIHMFLFGLWIYVEESTGILLAIVSVIYFVSLILTVVIQRSVIQLEKEINPEKKGELLEAKFIKDWESSLDEAQKLIQYKAGYKAYKCTNSTCMILWIFCIIGELALNIGIVPLLFVVIIWIVSTVAFQIEGVKLENHK